MSHFGPPLFVPDWDQLGKNIEKAFSHYKVYVEIDDKSVRSDRVFYLLKLKRGTRESQILDRARDVQLRLKLPLFEPFRDRFNICLAVSEKEIEYAHLPQIIAEAVDARKHDGKLLPYIVGHNVVGNLYIIDLNELPHLLVAGTTSSGKTVGLYSLITSIIYSCSPREVNFILIDVGAADLVLFDEVPHLSCPVVQDKITAYRVLSLLKEELEKRIDLKRTERSKFGELPQLVIVIDEFPALFAGTEDRQATKSTAEAVSFLLQRGRHGNMHVVLAAQNPTTQNMKVDLSNITARIAFKCAKRNFSETILGVGGAENLLGQGDMYFKSPRHTELLRIKGVFTSTEELQEMLSHIKAEWAQCAGELKFTINEADLQQSEHKTWVIPKEKSLTIKGEIADRQFAEVIMWVLGKDSVSCNTLQGEFSFGWSKARRCMERLNDLEIVSKPNAKLPRAVIPHSVDDIPAEVLEFLVRNGFSIEKVSGVLRSRTDD